MNILSMKEFSITMSQEIREYLKKHYPNAVISAPEELTENVFLSTVRVPNTIIAFTLLYSRYYDYYTQLYSHKDSVYALQLAKRIIIDTVVDAIDNQDRALSLDITRWNSVKDKVIIKLLGKNCIPHNKLNKIPHIELFDDLIVIFSILNYEEEGPSTSIDISYHLFAHYDIEIKDFYEHALLNTSRLLPHVKNSISAAINDLMDYPDLITPKKYHPLVMTNTEFFYGASTILYPGVLKSIAEECNNDIVIICSSIHEVLLLPYTTLEDLDYCLKMLRDINVECVIPTEVLSNNIYIFDKDAEKIVSNKDFLKKLIK